MSTLLKCPLTRHTLSFYAGVPANTPLFIAELKQNAYLIDVTSLSVQTDLSVKHWPV